MNRIRNRIKLDYLLREIKICYLCGEELTNRSKTTIDHMIANSKRHMIYYNGLPPIKINIKMPNLSPVHTACNNIKGDKSILATVKKLIILNQSFQILKNM